MAVLRDQCRPKKVNDCYLHREQKTRHPFSNKVTANYYFSLAGKMIFIIGGCYFKNTDSGLSPNIVIDNLGFNRVLSMRNVHKYLNEEGVGKFVIRGFNVSSFNSMYDYFDSRDDSYIVSSVAGSPKKKDLKGRELKNYLERLRKTDQSLRLLLPEYEDVILERDSLNKEINRRLSNDDSWTYYFVDKSSYKEFLNQTKNISSRSLWYEYIYESLEKYIKAPATLESFRFEIVDSAYNYIYTGDADAFAQDNIKYLSGIPEKLLEKGVAIRAYQDEIENVRDAFDIFQLISSMGTSEIADVITEKAIEYIEEKITDKGIEGFTRRNWFGLYPRLRKYMGLEIK